jgi:hypothetical protein
MIKPFVLFEFGNNPYKYFEYTYAQEKEYHGSI